jgi:pyrimidine operon attenuation protein/uracil phosphoribosyltransferase
MNNSFNVDDLIEKIVAQLRSEIEKNEIEEPIIVGIHTGGVWVARQLHEKLNCSAPLGTLNISFYRDDFTRIGVHPQVKPSKLPINLDGHDIILVDDVLYTGRTIRAALNEIFDYGRPKRVLLVALVDREGRELPIQADIVGAHVELEDHQEIKLNGPDPLELSIVSLK